MTDTPDLELFAYWRTSATYRVRVALNLKGLVARERFVDTDAGEQNSAEFRTLNPLGGIPVLVEDGHPPLTQSLAILEFIEEIAPSPPLLPADPHGRARVRSIASMMAGDTHPLITLRIRNYLTGKGGFDAAAWRDWQTHWFTTGLQALEKRLQADAQTGLYCHGDTVTMADICLASIVAIMRVFGIAVADVPTIDRIIALCDANEAFMRADPFRQEGAPPRS